jgi:ribosomal protein S19
MSRSKWKGPFMDTYINKDIQSTKQLSIWSRRSVIPLALINKSVLIHNGLTFKKILITREKVGFKFGAFVNTRNRQKKTKKK